MNVNIRNFRHAIPSLIKVNFYGQDDPIELNQASSWGWAHLKTGVSPIIRSLYARYGMSGWTDFGLRDEMANDIFGRYGYLNGIQSDGKPAVTWSSLGSTEGTLVINGDRPVHPPVDPHSVYIPMGWALEVIQIVELGITRVADVTSLMGFDSSKRTLIGRTANGTRHQVIRGHSGHKIELLPFHGTNQALAAQGI